MFWFVRPLFGQSCFYFVALALSFSIGCTIQLQMNISNCRPERLPGLSKLFKQYLVLTVSDPTGNRGKKKKSSGQGWSCIMFLIFFHEMYNCAQTPGDCAALAKYRVQFNCLLASYWSYWTSLYLNMSVTWVLLALPSQIGKACLM